jgi:hypothetical protein
MFMLINFICRVALVSVISTSTLVSASTSAHRLRLQVFAIDQVNGAEHAIGTALLKGPGSVFALNPQLLEWRKDKNAKFFLRGKNARLYDFEVLAPGAARRSKLIAVKTNEVVPLANMFDRH